MFDALTGFGDDESAFFTVFAPTDDAFGRVDSGLLEELANCTSALDSVLAFHAVAEPLTSDLLECGEQLTMGNGDSSRTVCRNGNIYQKGSMNSREYMPMVVEADIEACNGVVHIVDEVMLPKLKSIPLEACEAESGEAEEPAEEEPADEEPAEEEPAEEELAEEEPAEEETKECQTIAELACGNGDFSILCDLITEFELMDALSEGTWTVFAPTDAAFGVIDDNMLELDATNEQIESILKFHAVPYAAISFEDLPCQELTLMANDQNSRTKCGRDDSTGQRIKYQRGIGQYDGILPKITTADVPVCNGIVHIVDNVMIPKF